MVAGAGRRRVYSGLAFDSGDVECRLHRGGADSAGFGSGDRPNAPATILSELAHLPSTSADSANVQRSGCCRYATAAHARFRSLSHGSRWTALGSGSAAGTSTTRPAPGSLADRRAAATARHDSTPARDSVVAPAPLRASVP